MQLPPEWQPEWIAGHSDILCTQMLMAGHSDIRCTQMLRIKVKTSFLEGSRYHKVKVDKLIKPYQGNL